MQSCRNGNDFLGKEDKNKASGEMVNSPEANSTKELK